MMCGQVPLSGAEISTRTCPAGHELQPWTATRGICNGCGKRFPDGEQVMDCRRCEWLLCEVCCPRAGTKSTFWGALTQMPFYALHRLEVAFDSVDDALDDFADRHAAAFDVADKAFEAVGNKVDAIADYMFEDGVSDSSGERRRHNPIASPEEHEKATALVNEFCEDYSEVRFVPTQEDLAELWSRCSLLYSCSLSSGPLALAFSQQLDWKAGVGAESEPWQPRFRALLALEHLNQQGTVGQEIAEEVARRAGGRIKRLREVPQCSEKACSLVRQLLGETKQSATC
mmetsp:Transcript_125470/g.349212  ORF Transcript_125470/g.349212 Transcript_125470/m.349212 type:complete len:286 (-) Transcript_125470:143-1000(-)